jgi:hypothetical protein
MKKYTVLLAVLLFSGTAVLRADTMVFDRGLPTANLNDTAGANRSNVAWGDAYDTKSWATGDDFNLGMAGNVQITDLRVWIIGTDSQPLSTMWSDLTLFGGDTTAASVNVLTPTSVVISPATYADGSTYQGSLGGSINIWQVDFHLNWLVDGSTTHTFFVGGTPTQANVGIYGVGVSPSLHASNAALSGLPQQGADDLFREISYTGSTIDHFGTWDSAPVLGGGGWDKSSDINVQIFATPEPSAYILLGTVLLSLALLTRKKKHQEQR